MQEMLEIEERLRGIRREDMLLSAVSLLVSVLMVVVVLKASPSGDAAYMHLAVVGSVVNTIAMTLTRNKLTKERKELIKRLDELEIDL